MTNEDMITTLANPHALLNHQLGATDAHDAAIRCNWIRHWFDDVWQDAKSDTDRARPARNSRGEAGVADVLRCDMVALRGALECEEVYGALVSLPPEQRHLLFSSIQGPDRINLVCATLAKIPAGAAWLERKTLRDAATEASNRFVAESRAMAWEQGQPERVLIAIEAAGATLSLGKPKGILAMGEISPENMELLRTYRPGIEAILTARAAAAAPRVIA